MKSKILYCVLFMGVVLMIQMTRILLSNRPEDSSLSKINVNQQKRNIKEVFINKIQAANERPKHKTKLKPRREKDSRLEFSKVALGKSSSNLKLISNLRAINKTKYLRSFGRKYKEKDGYVFYISDKFPKSEDIQWSHTNRPVVMNQHNGKLGVVTGHILVKYKDSKQAKQIPMKYPLKNVKHFPHLKIIDYVPSKRKINISAIFKQLSAQKSIQRVNLDIDFGREKAI